jgi:SNF2 family DNA or RNA helicase
MREELARNMASVAHVVRKENAVDLPDQTHVLRKVYLGKEERNAYDQLKNEFVLKFADQVVLATSALVEVAKLRQLTSGFIYSNGSVFQFGKSKVTELKNLLEEIGNEQVIIWCNYKQEITTLLTELPGSRAIWSETDDRNETIRDFQASRFQFLIANSASCAHGITFVNCCYNVYFSLNYSYELHEQSLNRCHRIGQKRPVFYYYLLADNSIDSVIYKALGQKQDVSNHVLNYLKEAGHAA